MKTRITNFALLKHFEKNGEKASTQQQLQEIGGSVVK